MKKININDTTVITGIYLIKYPNSKVYIGQAQNIHLRILEHNSRAKNNRRGDGKKPQLCDSKIRKYFPDGVKEYYILEECLIDKLDEREKYWINLYDALNKEKGYNFLDKGDVSGRRGVDNANASLTKEQLGKIIDLLLNHYELSYRDIAQQVGTSLRVVQNISWGKSYINDNLSYPLRNNIHNFAKKDKVTDYFNSEVFLINLKEDLKYSWWLAIETDLVNKYKIPLNILREINHGEKFSEIGDYTYPIRNKNIRNRYNLSKEDIINLLNDLKNTDISMTELGKKYGFGRAAISNINKGLAYPIKGYNYPARLTK